jgi:hypothetical protein
MKLLIAAVLLAGTAAGAQQPEAPKPHMDRTETVLLAGDAAAHMLDAYSTHRALQGPNHERMLPTVVARSQAGMYSVAAADVVLQWYIARRLTRAGHPKLAHITTCLDIAVDGSLGIHNMTLPTKPLPPAKKVVDKFRGWGLF